jgi:hypothetical protein
MYTQGLDPSQMSQQMQQHMPQYMPMPYQMNPYYMNTNDGANDFQRMGDNILSNNLNQGHYTNNQQTRNPKTYPK